MAFIKRILPTFAFAMLIAYFGYHALNGEQGVLNWIVVKNRIVETEAELAATVAERESLELRAERLRSDSLDLDYMEERARAILNVAHPRDFIVKTDARADR
ncbi:FtsB family cell division protein [Hyphobacterium marinum]|uniref:Septum formation initiator family protein n=1 Tax=Hyphobacterium marinum TaxID=3116574 RepID=A0ABU7M119_9PROT|nr:septum formation initiator family protein [Hyphobacterium sp. Y6023]MEE2567506.1 septum formation initiator family protein [Hyphobacterium sp. Y6023]